MTVALTPNQTAVIKSLLTRERSSCKDDPAGMAYGFILDSIIDRFAETPAPVESTAVELPSIVPGLHLARHTVTTPKDEPKTRKATALPMTKENGIIIALLSDGETNKDIADALGCHEMVVRRVKGLGYAYIDRFKQLLPGKPRQDYLRTMFGVMPEDLRF